MKLTRFLRASGATGAVWWALLLTVLLRLPAAQTKNTTSCAGSWCRQNTTSNGRGHSFGSQTAAAAPSAVGMCLVKIGCVRDTTNATRSVCGTSEKMKHYLTNLLTLFIFLSGVSRQIPIAPYNSNTGQTRIRSSHQPPLFV